MAKLWTERDGEIWMDNPIKVKSRFAKGKVKKNMASKRRIKHHKVKRGRSFAKFNLGL